MNKSLPDNIDDFFSERLKNYAEEPDEMVWAKIDNRLNETEQNKPYFSAWKIVSAAAVIAACLLLPFLLLNPYKPVNNVAYKQSVSKKPGTQSTNAASINYSAATAVKNLKLISRSQNNDESTGLKNLFGQNEIPVIIMPVFKNHNTFDSIENYKEPNGLEALNFLKNGSVSAGKVETSKAASTYINIQQKHNISIIPFFSFDHISGRFIEQYEFDNDDKDVYREREKTDISFTGGALAAYQLNKKFSLLAGFSMSASALSISSTAVKALKDGNGIYKFKLATSYGFAEISKSGITPAAGDSLLISSAEMEYNYITFPVLLGYNINTKKIKLSVHTGIAFNSITSDKVMADYEVQGNKETETIKRVEGIRKSFFTVNTGIEASYNVGKNFEIGISPELRYGINSINKGTPVKTFPINYGLALTMHINL